MNNKPLLIFIPGTLCTSEMFMPILAALPCEAKTLEFSDHDNLRDMANAVLKIANGRSFIPVGFSMGGMVSFELLRMQLPQIAGMILIDSNSHADISGRKTGRDKHLATAKIQGIEALIRHEYLPVYFNNPQSPESEIVVRMAVQLGIHTLESQLRVLDNRPDSSRELKNFNKPTLIIAGENDRPCPPEHQQIMAKAARQSELHILPNCGHFAPLEAPASIANIITQWVNKHYA